MIILAGVIIANLNNSGIISRGKNAVTKTNIKQVQEIATASWGEAIIENVDATVDELKTAIRAKMLQSGITEEELNKYWFEVSSNGVKVVVWDTANWEKLTDSVAATVDGVPIPKGFVASPYGADKANGKAENTKAGGLVIYELNEGEKAIPSAESYQTSLTTRNQYVWVPVDRAIWEETSTEGITNTETLEEIEALNESIEKYGGFYVARYEAGVDFSNKRDVNTTTSVTTLANVHSKKNKIPYNYISTEDMIKVARSLYTKENDKYGVVSTGTYERLEKQTRSWLSNSNNWPDTDINFAGIDAFITNYYTKYKKYFDPLTRCCLMDIDVYHYADTRWELLSTEGLEDFDPDPSDPWRGSFGSIYYTTGSCSQTRGGNLYDFSDNVEEMLVDGIENSGSSYMDCGEGFRPCLYIKL